MRTHLRRTLGVATAAVLTLGAGLVAGPSAQAAAVTQTVSINPKGSIDVVTLGGGHGHGLSQFGAYGAAVHGRTTSQILAGYYPGTTTAGAPSPLIRVRLSGTGPTLTVQAIAGLKVTGVSAALPTAGILHYRLIAGSGHGLVLQRQTKQGKPYTTVKTGLPNGAQFGRAHGAPIRVYHADHSTTIYMGGVHAVRVSASGKAGGVYPVNYVNTEWYTAGVVPREMPASWSRAALDAQAIAARTYAVFENTANAGQPYTICDTSACQVYGGHEIFDAHGKLIATDLASAATDTHGKILKYKGATIFAQYSASNGGWSTAGGKPYLKAAADKYDAGAPGNWYTDVKSQVTAASMAKALGMSTVTKLTVSRDGHGSWGGRITSVTATGTKSGKAYVRKGISATTFAAAVKVTDTTWISLAMHK